MQALVFVKNLDVLPNSRFSPCPSLEALVVDHFIFKAAPEALNGRVIITVAFSRHGSHQAVFLEDGAISLGAILAAAVRVMDQSRWGTPML